MKSTLTAGHKSVTIEQQSFETILELKDGDRIIATVIQPYNPVMVAMLSDALTAYPDDPRGFVISVDDLEFQIEEAKGNSVLAGISSLADLEVIFKTSDYLSTNPVTVNIIILGLGEEYEDWGRTNRMQTHLDGLTLDVSLEQLHQFVLDLLPLIR